MGSPNYPSGFHTTSYAPPNTPLIKQTNLPPQPTVRIYCQACKNLSVTARNGTVVLAPADANDYYQHWIKDMSHKMWDQGGFPAFALVNRVTGQALKNPTKENEPVSLVPYNPNNLEESVQWTQLLATDFHCIRITSTPSLSLTATAKGEYFFDGAKIVVSGWQNTPVQHWKIVPYTSNVPY